MASGADGSPGSRLANPFAEGSGVRGEESEENFLAFGKTSTPTDQFKIQHGKANRRGNWTNFGQSVTPTGCTPRRRGRGWFRGQSMEGSGISGGGGYRSSPGFFGQQEGPNRGTYGRQSAPSNFLTPNNFRNFSKRGGGGSRYNSPRSGNRDQGGANGSYFHPSMLEDPWAEFRCGPGNDQGDVSIGDCDGKENDSLSDSMLPQVDDTILDRNQDLSSSSFPVDDDSSITDSLDDQFVAKSDSMIPLVSDSILDRDTSGPD